MSSKRFNAMKLCGLIRKIFNGSTSMIVEDVAGNMVEDLHNFALVRGEEFHSLHKCLESSKNRFELLNQTGFELATEALRDDFMKELLNRGHGKSVLCMQHQLWESVSNVILA